MLRNWVAKNAPEHIKDFLRPPYQAYLWARRQVRFGVRRIYRFADKYRIIGPNQIYDESYYSERKSDLYRSDGHAVSDVLYKYFEPNSVIDFGCAVGVYLEPFHERSIEIHGVDGNENALKHAVVPTKYLELWDLRDPYHTGKEYDLLICFETAEHLPEEYAETLIESLASAGQTVAFTAAPPGQDGTHHVNLQHRQYWIDKFRQKGMEYDDEAVEAIREQIAVERANWIPRNLYIFKNAV